MLDSWKESRSWSNFRIRAPGREGRRHVLVGGLLVWHRIRGRGEAETAMLFQGVGKSTAGKAPTSSCCLHPGIFVCFDVYVCKMPSAEPRDPFRIEVERGKKGWGQS